MLQTEAWRRPRIDPQAAPLLSWQRQLQYCCATAPVRLPHTVAASSAGAKAEQHLCPAGQNQQIPARCFRIPQS